MQFDCARCEELLLDFVYGELDEVTSAAYRRHSESCARCAGALSDVKVVREAFSMLPLEAPSATLDARILAAADRRLSEIEDTRRAHQRAQSRSPIARLFDLFRAAAVRPQFAMALVLVIVVGMGLLVTPQLRTAEQPAPGIAPTLEMDRGPELAPAPSPPAVALPQPVPTPSASDEVIALARPTPADADAPLREDRAAPRPRSVAGRRGARDDLADRLEETPQPTAGDRDTPSRGVAVAPAPLQRGGGDYQRADEGGLGYGQVPLGQEPARQSVARSVRSAEERSSTGAWSQPPPAPAAPAASASPSVPAQSGQSLSVAGSGSGGFETGMTSYRGGRYRQAIADLEASVARPGLSADALATAHLAIARSYRQIGNCSEATTRYEDLMRRFSGYRSNADVNWEIAECFRSLGNNRRADEHYRVAERSARYGERARARRVQITGARRAAPSSFDAADEARAVEPSSASPSTTSH